MVMIVAREEMSRRELEQALAVRPMPAGVEQAFGRCILAGREAERELASIDLPAAERAALAAEAALGRWARDRLVEYNLPLVLSIARRYVDRGLDTEDLRQEGTIGLMRAIDGFDWDRGLRLSTYATFWIRQSISRAIADRGRLIRLPVNAQVTLGEMLEVARALTVKLGRQPRPDEVAAAVGISPERATELMQATGDAVSFDAQVGAEGRPLEETVGDNSPGPEDLACQTLARAELEAALAAVLTPREVEVIRLRFGLADGVEWTLEAIGGRIGVTRERARQLEVAAIAKLREAAAAGLLRASAVAA